MRDRAAYMHEYRRRPEVKERARVRERGYYQLLETKAKKRAYRQRPEVKEKDRIRMRAYKQRPEVKARPRKIEHVLLPSRFYLRVARSSARVQPSTARNRELTCVYCGRPLLTPTSHAEPQRDEGHKPFVAEELDPKSEIALRRLM